MQYCINIKTTIYQTKHGWFNDETKTVHAQSIYSQNWKKCLSKSSVTSTIDKCRRNMCENAKFHRGYHHGRIQRSLLIRLEKKKKLQRYGFLLVASQLKMRQLFSLDGC